MDPITIISAATALARATGLADIIGKKLEGTKAQKVAEKVVSVASAVTGITDPAEMADIVAGNLELQKELRIRLIDLNESEIRYEAEDRANARAREIAIVTSDQAPLLVKLVPSILALGTVGLTYSVFFTLIFVDMDERSKDVMIYILGVLSSALMTILTFHFGSSKASQLREQQAAQTVADLAKRV